MELLDRITAIFFGIAIGDSLGMPYEKVFSHEKLLQVPPDVLTQYQDPPPGHQFHDGKVRAGDITDDTQLSVVVAESLLAKGGIDMEDMARRHIEAMDQRISGWGKGTLSAVERLKRGESWLRSGVPGGAGNGIAMKVSPVGILLAARADDACGAELEEGLLQLAGMTHASRMGLAQGVVQARFVAALLKDSATATLEGAIEALREAIRGCRSVEEGSLYRDDGVGDLLWERLDAMLAQRHYQESLTVLAAEYGSRPFYVYDSLPLSYACFLRSPQSFDAVLDAIRCAGDTDTNASIVGALLGARNGMAVFPEHLVAGLKCRDEIYDLARRFYNRFYAKEQAA